MNTTTTPRPIHGVCRWLVRPNGKRPGVIRINEVTYLIRRTKRGYVLHKDNNRDVYLVRPEDGICGCPDHQNRKRECKHLKSLKVLLPLLAPREPGQEG